MNLDKIKNLVKQNGDKFIFVENGEPELVVMSFHEYEKLANGNRHLFDNSAKPRNFERRERVGFADLDPRGVPETEVVVSPGFESGNLSIRLEDIRPEDLPI